MAEDEYGIGYKKPPEKTRFKKGTSGNPSGRPKGRKNFVPLDTANIKIFQKQIVDAGYEEIQVVKDGVMTSMSKMDALLAQLYNRAMNGDLGASKILLQHTHSSLLDLDNAAHRTYSVTMKLRKDERSVIFSPAPTPDTFGAFLEYEHKEYSYLFAQREVFGVEAVPYILEGEPKIENDWPAFNDRMRSLYKNLGDEPSAFELSKIPTVITATTDL